MSKISNAATEQHSRHTIGQLMINAYNLYKHIRKYKNMGYYSYRVGSIQLGSLFTRVDRLKSVISPE